jgi:hypothetical protein
LKEEQGTAALALEVAALRYRLRALGVTRDEEEAAIAAATREITATFSGRSIALALRRVVKIAKTAGDLFATRLTAENPEESSMAKSLYGAANAIVEELEDYATSYEAGKITSPKPAFDILSNFVRQIADLSKSLGGTSQFGTPRLFLDDREAKQELRNLEFVLREEQARLSVPEWATGGSLPPVIDKLLQGPAPSTIPAPPTREPERRPSFTVPG